MTAADPTGEADTGRPEIHGAPPEPVPEGEDTGPDQGEDTRYRRRLREATEATAAAEAERDQLRDRLEQHQRTEVTRLAGEQLAKPEALWATGVQLVDLLDDAGQVDTEKVQAATASAIADLGLVTRPRQLRPDPSQGARPQDRITDTDNPWANLLHRK